MTVGVLPTRGVSHTQIAFLMVAALAASLVVLSAPLPLAPAISGAGVEERAVEGYGDLPISFEPNVGQAPGRFDFVARGQGFGMAINATGATLALGTKETQDLVRLNLLGANRSAHPRALESLPGKVNYFIGNDPAKWLSEVSTFGRVSYSDVLQGIDVTYYGTTAGTLEYDFVVAPDADPGDIRVKFSGANDVALRGGSLVITTAGGAVTQEAPVLYQTIAGRRVPVDGRFSLEGDEVGFEVGPYDDHYPLVIDPTLTYSTYLGGSSGDVGYAIAVDGTGAAYVTGYTASTNFPNQASFQGANAGPAGTWDAFVTKLNPAGSALIYSTYLGGSGNESGYAIAVDGTGAAYVTGATNSTNFPTQAPIQGSNAGGGDAFVTKLNATGQTLIYSTYLGGTGSDVGRGIAVDSTHASYVTGSTYSTNFPTQVPFQGSNAGSSDAFVTKLNATGSALAYSTYLGGSSSPAGAQGVDFGSGIAVDGAGAAYVTGSTSSTNFPTQAPFQGSNSGNYDAFVTNLNAAGSALIYSTYLGGSGSDYGYGIAVDGAGAAYVTGSTPSTNFPTQAPFQGSNAGGSDAFVTKLNATGQTLIYSTYLGGSNGDPGYGIAVDGAGAAYVTGATYSTNFPTQVPFQGSRAGNYDAFVTKLADTPPATCGGQTVTIQVMTANQTTSGTAGADVINGTAGIDTINGLGGNDIICSLGGNDNLTGGNGNDTLHGNNGKDTLYGGAGDDTLYGNDGDDTLGAGLGIGGQTPPDTLYGGDGNDTLNGGAFGDKLDGGAGNDSLNGNGAWDKLYGGTGKDTLYGNDGNDHLYGNADNDTLYGNDGNDYLNGGNGGANNDYCNGGAPPTGDSGALCETSTNIP